MHPLSKLTTERRVVSRVAIGAIASTLAIAGLSVIRIANAQDSTQDSTQDTMNEVAARELAASCSKSLEAQDFESAHDQCSRAEKIYPSREKPPALLVLLARSCRGVGKFVCAYDAYNRVASMGPRKGLSPDAEKVQQSFIDEGRRERSIVAEKLGQLTLSIAKAVPGAKVMLDDSVIQSGALGVKLPIDPGKHLVLADAPGYEHFEHRFEIAEKEVTSVAISLKPEIIFEPPPTPPVQIATSGGRQIATWSAFGVGGAGLIVGTIFGAQWLSLSKQLIAECTVKAPDGRQLCPATLKSGQSGSAATNTYTTDGTIAGISFGVAGAGIAVGTILLLTAPKAPPPKTGFTLSPEVGFGTIGAAGSF